MPRTEVTIRTEDGTCAAGLHTPSEPGSHPAVIMFPDAGGRRETISAMADRLAELGYTVLLPDVYYRSEWAPFDLATVFSDPDERKRLFETMGTLTPERIVKDTGAFLDFLAGRPEVSGTGVGTTGYCMGGRLSLTVAGHHPDRIAAAASFHGGNLAPADDPDSPHLLADRIQAAVLVAGAENDSAFPAEQFERLDQALTAAGVRHTIETYPAAHGFVVGDNPTYDAAAAERHWTALAGFYGKNLQN
jgi:carboxymethylenebutenolidase